jgi:hypothetical protein
MSAIQIFAKFIQGPFTEWCKGNEDEYPLFSHYVTDNHWYPVQFVRKCFQQGLKGTDTYEGKSVFSMLVSALLAGSYTVEYLEQIDTILDLCMDKEEFPTILQEILITEEDVEEAQNNVKGYLLQYAKKHSIFSADFFFDEYSSIHWEENTSKNIREIYYSDMKYWYEYDFEVEYDNDEDTYTFIDCTYFYTEDEINKENE